MFSPILPFRVIGKLREHFFYDLKWIAFDDSADVLLFLCYRVCL